MVFLDFQIIAVCDAIYDRIDILFVRFRERKLGGCVGNIANSVARVDSRDVLHIHDITVVYSDKRLNQYALEMFQGLESRYHLSIIEMDIRRIVVRLKVTDVFCFNKAVVAI